MPVPVLCPGFRLSGPGSLALEAPLSHRFPFHPLRPSPFHQAWLPPWGGEERSALCGVNGALTG